MIINGTFPNALCLPTARISFVCETYKLGEFDFYKLIIYRTANEVRTLYGLHDPTIPSQRANEIVYSVFQLFGKSVDQNILKDEFVKLLDSGGDLIDCEYDGHHGDDEWEVHIILRPLPFRKKRMYVDGSLRYTM
jgi:hypothetical protein